MKLAQEDLEYILDHTRDLWEELRGQRLFITGGTGFFGCWLLESFAWATDRLGLKSQVLVLTRDHDAFRKKAPHLASHPAIYFHIGDVRNFTFIESEYSHIIHAATEANPELQDKEPLLMLDGIIQGTRHTLDFAVHCRAKKFLLASSGAVYGKQPPELTHITESYNGAPDTMDIRSTYGEGKRVAELLCAIYANTYKLDSKIARCFAFVGPYLHMDKHFAIGNFIRDAMNGHAINISGDGSPYRSYLYASDLAISLWTILFKGQTCYPYNVGSDNALTIESLACEVAHAIAPNCKIKIGKQSSRERPAERYVPLTKRLRDELNVKQGINLHDAIKRTSAWYSKYSKEINKSHKGDVENAGNKYC